MGVRTRIAMRLGAATWAPRFLPQIVWLDKRLQRVTRGRVGFVELAGLPGLTLTVPGRTSGLPRTTPLLCTPYGDGWLVAGSAFGSAKPPAWVANLRAAGGTATARTGRSERTVSVRELEGEERAQAWAAMVALWPNYEAYAERSGRTIPVFLLRPTST